MRRFTLIRLVVTLFSAPVNLCDTWTLPTPAYAIQRSLPDQRCGQFVPTPVYVPQPAPVYYSSPVVYAAPYRYAYGYPYIRFGWGRSFVYRR